MSHWSTGAVDTKNVKPYESKATKHDMLQAQLPSCEIFVFHDNIECTQKSRTANANALPSLIKQRNRWWKKQKKSSATRARTRPSQLEQRLHQVWKTPEIHDKPHESRILYAGERGSSSLCFVARMIWFIFYTNTNKYFCWPNIVNNVFNSERLLQRRPAYEKINNIRLSVVLMEMQNKDVNRALLLLAIFADFASAHVLPRWCAISSSPSPRFLLPTFENVCQSSTMGGRSAPRLTRCWPHQLLPLRFLHVSPIAWVESSTFASPSPTAV